MAKTFTVKVNTNQLNKAMKSIQRRVERVSMDALMECAEKGLEYAKELYETAEYDGEHDAKLYIDASMYKRTVELIAHGYSVNFIEYGTGISGNTPGRWYFSKKGRDIKLTATGEPATYTRGGYLKKRTYYIGARGGKHYVNPDISGEEFVRDSDWNATHIVHYVGSSGNDKQTLPLQTETEWIPQTEVTRADSFVTQGNPPNLVMHRTKQYIAEIAPEIHKKHLSKLK